MKDIQSLLETFGLLVDQEHLYIDPSCGFHRICDLIGADPGAIDRALEESLGYTGDEIIREYRKQYHRRLAEKYGISL